MKKLIILCLILSSSIFAFKALAQEDYDMESDNPSIVPQPNQTSTPTPVMDDVDAGPISDADEYDVQ